MFERYTEKARRTIFFARYEASQFGAAFIETEHLLLGLLREDHRVLPKLPREQIRREIESRVPRREQIATSVDLPLSKACKRILAYGAEESASLQHAYIDTRHLALALLREEGVAREVLEAHGVKYDALRAEIAGLPPPADFARAYDPGAAFEPVSAIALALCELVRPPARAMLVLAEREGDKVLAGGEWTRKQALGHLIDWATTHHNWCARVLSQEKLDTSGYPEVEWARCQPYQAMHWMQLVAMWTQLQEYLIHLIDRVPDEKWATLCRIGGDEAIPFSKLMENYTRHCEEVLGKILTRG